MVEEIHFHTYSITSKTIELVDSKVRDGLDTPTYVIHYIMPKQVNSAKFL